MRLFLDNARLWVVGINPGTRSSLVDAPFAHPGNRFWPAFFKAGITPWQVDARDGFSDRDVEMLASLRLGFTNFVDRTTARASSLTRSEIVDGGRALAELAEAYRPGGIMVLGLGAYRTAYSRPRAVKGLQEERIGGAPVWLVGNPSGLNAHESVDSLALAFREVWKATNERP